MNKHIIPLSISLLCASTAYADDNLGVADFSGTNLEQKPALTDFYGAPAAPRSANQYNQQIQQRSQANINQIIVNPNPPTFETLNQQEAAWKNRQQQKNPKQPLLKQPQPMPATPSAVTPPPVVEPSVKPPAPLAAPPAQVTPPPAAAPAPRRSDNSLPIASFGDSNQNGNDSGSSGLGIQY